MLLSASFLFLEAKGDCSKIDERCQVCINNVCLRCVHSYTDATGACVDPTLPVDGCYSYRIDGVCQWCDYGYYRSMDSLCYKLSDRNNEVCYFSNLSPTACSHCKRRILSLYGKCDVKRTCSDPKCLICFVENFLESCDKCVPGYTLLGPNYLLAKCVRTTNATEGCLFTDNPEYCMNCFIGYYTDNGVCKPTDLTLLWTRSFILATMKFFLILIYL
jgi:hypothetical protein